MRDAHLAALEHNCTFVTTDRLFGRFPRVRGQHPLDDERPKQNPA